MKVCLNLDLEDLIALRVLLNIEIEKINEMLKKLPDGGCLVELLGTYETILIEIENYITKYDKRGF